LPVFRKGRASPDVARRRRRKVLDLRGNWRGWGRLGAAVQLRLPSIRHAMRKN
jgi:hypothetical protein